jgi:hypothetical protein
VSGLPSLLLVVVIVTHYGYDLIASFYPDALASAKAWASVLRAVEAVALYFIVLALAPVKPWIVRKAVACACAWGAFESAQIAVCRLAFPMNRPPPEVSQYTGLCDKVTGLPVYMLTVSLVLLVAVLRKP